MLWESRELPSRVYGWVAFSTANILCEIPYAVLFAVIYFVTWYYPVGFPYDSSTAGYVFFIILVYFVCPRVRCILTVKLFIPSWAQWIAAFARDYTIVANILPFFLVMTLLISGVIIPYGMPRS
jgi:ATP-binding cassette subfamily G (WHITE) protein 2 (SNQ2)